MLATECARLDAIVRNVCAAVFEDYRKGRLGHEELDDRDDLNSRVLRKANVIRQQFHAPPPQAHFVCDGCGAEGEMAKAAVIAGGCYCQGCAAGRRRTPPPRFAP